MLVVVVGLLVALLVRRRSHDDEHSVQLYHRSLHTLEEIGGHPHDSEQNGNAEVSAPASAFRVSGSSAVRLTEPGRVAPPPPVPPPPLPPPSPAIRFEDSAIVVTGPAGTRAGDEGTGGNEAPGEAAGEGELPGEAAGEVPGEAGGEDEVPGVSGGAGAGEAAGENEPADEVEEPAQVPATFMSGSEDPAMHSINRRPRRLGAPAAAVAAVAVLIVVLVVAGMHTNKPNAHRGAGATGTTSTTTRTTAAVGGGKSGSTTTTTAAPLVSAPASASAHAATYQISAPSYTLSVAATNGSCWIQATDTATGSVLFSSTLTAGQSHSLSVTGPTTVIAGAPNAFSATVNGTALTLPTGFQAPFTLTLDTASST